LNPVLRIPGKGKRRNYIYGTRYLKPIKREEDSPVQSYCKNGLGKLVAVFLMLGLLFGLGSAVPAVAETGGGGVSVTLNLSKSTAYVGDRITASGKDTPSAWVPLKVLDSNQNIVVFDATKSDAEGNYSIDFIVPEGIEGVLTVVTGSGSNVASKNLTITRRPGGGGGGGGGGASPAVNTTGQASINPFAGGKVSLSSDVSLNIPAGALKGTTKVDVTIKKVSDPPAAPTGFKILGSVYEFKVDGSADYNFNKNVTLTFKFDPASVPAGERPSVYYYDEASSQWVNLGGTISGSNITISVNHFTSFAVLVKETADAPGTTEPEPGTPVPGQLFSDVPASYWASEAINELSELGCISGYPDGTFKPENRITRAEFAVVLVKAYNINVAAGKVFDDTAGHWAKDYIASAYAAGIVSGYDENSFGPDDPITREQMAVLIVKAAGLPPAAGESQFTDSAAISGWAKGAVATAAENGIINGYPDQTFRPQGNATRAEAVTVIAKALSK
jgi:hypothetical protein